METIRNCDLFMFALSPESIDSKACSQEYNYAAKLGKVVLPILVSESVSINVLPRALSAIQFIDYRKHDKEAALELVKSLNHLPEAKPLPDPLPEPPPAPVTYLSSIKEQVETTGALNFEEQSALFLKLKGLHGDAAASADSLDLLRRLRKRRDLFATIAQEIDYFIKRKIPPRPPDDDRTKDEHVKARFCRNCQAALIPNAKFCRKCGTKVT